MNKEHLLCLKHF